MWDKPLRAKPPKYLIHPMICKTPSTAWELNWSEPSLWQHEKHAAFKKVSENMQQKSASTNQPNRTGKHGCLHQLWNQEHMELFSAVAAANG